MNLYRPVGLHELELIYDSGMRAFPARLPQQPIFYPVIDLEYARQVASDWNTKNGQFAGYVTQFKVEDSYIDQFETHTVGESRHEEFWIPAEEVEEFNRHIIGHIKVVEAQFGEAFQGFVPDNFGLQGKNAVEQFTLLANSFVYKRMEFYLEIKRNHKAIFLNYLFWHTYDFKNQGLKEKVLQGIKEAWLTSFPKIPLPMPVLENSGSVKQTDSHSPVRHDPEDELPLKQTDSLVGVSPVSEEPTEEEPTDSDSPEKLDPKETKPLKRPASPYLVTPHRDSPFAKQKDPRSLLISNQENVTPSKQKVSHFSQGLELGLSGKYREAVDELSKAVEENRNHIVARTSLGVAFHRLGEDDRALSCYEAALKIDPKYAEAHYFRANILHSRGNVPEAIAAYTIAISLRPELIEAHQKPLPHDRLTDYTGTPAEIYRISKLAYRILDLNKSLESNPRDVSLLKERAAEYYRLRNYEQAIADYSSSLAIQPDDAGALHLRGLAYEQIGQSERALEDFRRAVAIDPQLSNVYLNRGVALGQMGNFRQSLASLSEGIRLAPENPDGYFNRGTTYFQLGDFKSAIDDFSNVIRLSPGDEAAYYWRGISNEEAGRRREAIADYRQFLALSKDANARYEIEQKLRQWNADPRDRESSPGAAPDERQKINRVQAEEPEQDLDLKDLIIALGDRAVRSTWFGSEVDCYGENAGKLFDFTDNHKPIEGRDFLQITSGIYQTIEGDFQAFDPGATSPWIFIRAWEGSGFYIETNDPQIKKQLKTHFRMVEEVEGPTAPYEGLFIRV